MIGKNVCFYSKMTKKAKKRHGTYSKNYFISLDQNPKIENFEKKFRKIDHAKNGSDTQPKEMVKNLLETFLKPKLSFLIENGHFHPYSLEKSRIFGEIDRF